MHSRFRVLGTIAASFLIGLVGRVGVADDCGPYTVVDNGEFSVEFLEYDYDPSTNDVAFFYEVCKLGEGPEVSNLSHWSIDLHSFVRCLKPGCTPDDFIPICAQTVPFDADGTPGPYILEGADDPNAPTCVLGVDPTTGIPGLKFDNLQLGDGKCQRFAFVFDLDCLRADHKVVAFCVEVATKAGNQDIRDDEVPNPGYGELTGPICKKR